MSSDNTTIYIGPSYMPDGTPVPDLLTEEEAIIFLRLDIDGPKNAKLTLKYYRDNDLLCPTKIGKRNRYQRTELLSFLDKLTNNKCSLK